MIHRLTLPLLLALLLGQAACGHSVLRDDLLPDGDLAVAEDVLRGQLAKQPGDPETRLRMGVLLFRAQRYEEAKKLLSQAAASMPDSVDALHYLGLTALELGAPDEAVQHLLAAAEAAPEYEEQQKGALRRALRAAIDHDVEASAFKDAGRYAEKLVALGYSEEQDRERMAKAFVGLGDVYYDAGYYRDALDAYSRAEPFADPALLAFDRGRVQALLGKNEEAAREFDRFLSGQGDDPAKKAEVLRKLGAFYESNFKFVEAEDAYRRSAEVFPDQTGLYWDLAVLYLKLRRFDDADAAFGKHMSTVPESGREQELMEAARQFIKFQNQGMAVAYLQKAIAAAPGDLAPRNALARLYLRLGQRDELRALYHDYVTVVGGRVAQVQAARALSELGQYEDAKGLLEQALAAGADPALRLEVADLQQQLGQEDARDRTLADLISGATDPPVAREQVGLRYREYQLPDKAIATLEEAVRARPSLERATFALADLYRSRDQHTPETKLLARYVASAPDPVAARLAVGKRFAERGDAKEAIPYLEGVAAAPAEHDADAAKALLLLGTLHLSGHQKDLDKAASYFRAYIARAKDRLAATRTVAQRVKPQVAMADLVVEVYEEMTRLDPSDADALYALGEAYVDANRFEQSLPAFTRYIQRSEDRGAAIETVALYLFGKGREPEALKLFADLGGDEIRNPSLHRRLGNLYRKRGDMERARYHFEKFLSSASARPRELRTFGDQLFRAQMFDLAARAYEVAMASPNEREQVAQNLAICYLKLRRPDQAEAMFQRYIAAEPDKPKTRERVAQKYYEENELGRALSHFRAAFVPENRRSLDNIFARMADILMKLGRRDEVVGLAHDYILLQGSRQSAREKAADQLRALGLRAEAVRIYREILVDRPGDQEVMERVAEELVRSGDTKAGVAELEKLVSLRGFAPRAIIDAAQLLERRGLYDEALALVEDGVERGKKDPWLLLERSQLLMRRGDVGAAHAGLLEALPLAPELGELLGRIYDLYASAERNDLALDITRRAIGLFPQEPDHQLKLVDLLLTAGQREEADQAAYRFLKLDELGAARLAATYGAHDEYERAIAHYRKALEQPLVSDAGGVIRALTDRLLFAGEVSELDSVVAQYLVSARDRTRAYKEVALAYLEADRSEDAVRYLIEADRDDPAPELRRLIALRLFADGKVDEARRWFELYMADAGGRRAPLRLPPSADDRDQDPIGRMLTVADFYGTHGYPAEAERVLNQGLSEYSDDGELAAALVVSLVDRGEIRRALSELESFMERGGTLDAANASAISTRLVLAGREREAAEVVSRALTTRFVPSLAVELLGLYVRLGELGAAEEVKEKLVAHSGPDELPLLLQIAKTTFAAGRLDMAEPLLRDVVAARDPRTQKDAVQLLMRVMLLRGDEGGVAQLFDDVASHTDDKLEASRNLSAITFNLQRWDLAQKALETWMRLDPTSAEPARLLVGVALFRGDDEQLWGAVDAVLDRTADRAAELDKLAKQFDKRLRYDLAQEARERLLDHARADADLTYLAGQSALLAGDIDQARRHFARFVELDDRKSTAHRQVASELLADSRVGAAREHIDEGLAAEGPAWRVLLAKGRAALFSGDVAGARQAFDQSAEAAPNPELAYLNAAYLLFATPDMTPELAYDLAVAALARKANLPGGLLAKAVSELMLGRIEEAEADMARYDKLGYNVMVGHLELAKRALLTRAFDVAREHFDTVLTRNDDRTAALHEIANAIRDVNEREDLGLTEADHQQLRALSLRYVGQLLESDPTAAWYVTLESDVLETSGDIAGAIAVYREAMMRQPMDSALYNNLAYLYARRGENLEEALSLVRRARALDPSQNVFYLDTEGWVLFQMGRYDEAATLIEASIRQMEEKQGSSLSESFWHLGQVHEKLGHEDKARQAYRTALRLDPSGRYGLRARSDLTRMTAL